MKYFVAYDGFVKSSSCKKKKKERKRTTTEMKSVISLCRVKCEYFVLRTVENSLALVSVGICVEKANYVHVSFKC